MKNFSLKKTLIAVSLAASMAIPAAASFAAPATSYAATPFISDTDYNGAINIDESQISVSCKRYTAGGMAIQTKVSGSTIKQAKSITSLPVFSRCTISFKVSGTRLTKNIAENAKLYVTYHINDKKNSKTYSSPKVRTVSGSSNTFYIDFDIITHGESFEFSTSELAGVKNLKCSSASISSQSGSSNYYYIEAKTPGGENVFINTKHPGNYNTNVEKLAKKLCMYANSLSDVTGVKLGTVYILSDDPYTENYPAWGLASGYRLNDKGDKYGYVGTNYAASAVELDYATNHSDVMTWTMMHEISHCYAISSNLTNFFDNYRFNDEYLTNARGLTAIQNCDNLRNMDININEYYEKYDEIFAAMNPNTSDPCGFHAKKLVEIGKTYGWDKLEQYFKADEVENSYLSDDNYDYANTLKNYLGKNFSTNNGVYLRYVNSFRKLMKLCWGYCNEQGFTSFVEQHFTKAGVISTLTNLGVIK